MIRRNLAEAIGNTPLIRLRKASEQTGCEILGKAEFMNPGGSVKDRIARYMIEQALDRGDVEPGTVVIENSSGNTAMGLAMMAVMHGLTCRMVVRQQTSREKLHDHTHRGTSPLLRRDRRQYRGRQDHGLRPHGHHA